jgi:hypothetical protein
MELLICLMLLATPAALPVTEVSIVDSAVAEPLTVTRTEASPERFVAVWTHTMPTPGWTFELDRLSIDGDRIGIDLTAIRPEGMVAQVEAPGRTTIELGALPRGRYFLEIRLRRGALQDYRPAFAALLDAH